jgi:hypothetical protein
MDVDDRSVVAIGDDEGKHREKENKHFVVVVGLSETDANVSRSEHAHLNLTPV